MNVVAIVVTYNGLSWIDKCLGSLTNSTFTSDIIVVDNASTDQTVPHIKRYFPQVRLVESKTNLGFGKANNIGIKEAITQNADYIFLLNQDAWVEPNTLQTLIDTAQQFSSYGIISGVHLSGDGKQLDYGFSKYLSPDLCPGFLSDVFLHRDQLKNLYEISFVNAAAWLLSKECVINVGGFDPLFPHYGEDIDYTQRMAYHGFKVGICPQASVYHDRENDPKLLKKKSATSQRVFTQHLYVTKNINHSIGKAFWISISRSFKNAIDSIFSGDFSKAGNNIVLIFAIIRYFPRIYKSRKKSKLKGAYI